MFGVSIYGNTLYFVNPDGSLQYISDYGAETAVATNITDSNLVACGRLR